VAGGGRKRRRNENEERRGSFSWCTAWASHFLGSPSCCSIPNSFVDRLGATHIPLKRGGASVGGIQAWAPIGGIGNWAHIPQERGGAPGWGLCV